MAVSLLVKVWKHSPYSQSKLLVMLALAFHSDPSNECYLSPIEISKKTKISQDEVRSILNDFLSDGVIENTECATHFGFKVNVPQKHQVVTA